MTVYSDNFMDDYHICGLIVYICGINLTKLGSDTNKTISRSASQNIEYGYVTIASRYSRRVKSLP